MTDQLWYRYFGASVLALGVDFGAFVAFLSLGVPPAMAAACGYMMGVACHWVISSRAVFGDQLAAPGAPRRQQQGLFVLSALVGLGITTAIVGAASRFGLEPRLAKAVAVVLSFQATYLLRKKVVFTC